MGTAKKPIEDRFFPRYIAVTEAFNGQILRPGNPKPFNCKVLDVSRDGLGIISQETVVKGETLELHTLERVLHFQVAYCIDDLINKGNYRWGLRRIGSTENLVSLFAANGFIDKKEA